MNRISCLTTWFHIFLWHITPAFFNIIELNSFFTYRPTGNYTWIFYLICQGILSGMFHFLNTLKDI